MSYEAEQAARQQDATEALIRMRQPMLGPPMTETDKLKKRVEKLEKTLDSLIKFINENINH